MVSLVGTAPVRIRRLPSSLLDTLLTVGRRTIALAAFFTLWEVYPRVVAEDAVFLPPLSTVLASLRDLALSGDLLAHTQASLFGRE